jgi:hypothetical protein
MTSEQSCALWSGAKHLAKERGLKMTGKCPFDRTCTGEVCLFLDKTPAESHQVQKFYGKLERHRELVNARKTQT